MNTIGQKWNRFWFEPSTPDMLGIARILVYGSMAVFYLATPYLFPRWGWHETFNEWGGVSHVFWQPVYWFRVLHVPQLSVGTITMMDAVWKLALLLSAIGLFTRPANIVTAILGAYLFGLPNNFGRIHHLDILLLWSFITFSASRCGDAWSIDCLIKAAKTREPNLAPVRSGEYTWPIRMIWVVMAVTYFEAGVSKLRHSGIHWFAGDSMAHFMMRSQYHVTDAEPLTNWGLLFAQHPMMGHLLALAGLSLEVGYPLALFGKRLRYIIAPSGMLMQTGIAVLMGPNFYQMIICQLLWLPLDKFIKWLTSIGAGRNKYTLIYDGSCGLCQSTMAVVRRLDLQSRVEFLDALGQWPLIQQRYPQLDQEKCLADMHAVSSSGRVRVGFEAYRGLAWVVPLGWVILPVFYIPGVAWVGRRVYRAVADSRHNGSCAMPPAPVGAGNSKI